MLELLYSFGGFHLALLGTLRIQLFKVRTSEALGGSNTRYTHPLGLEGWLVTTRDARTIRWESECVWTDDEWIQAGVW